MALIPICNTPKNPLTELYRFGCYKPGSDTIATLNRFMHGHLMSSGSVLKPMSFIINNQLSIVTKSIFKNSTMHI